MARLNESTASAEPIEILKRRFVRQNREIARVNSIQSLRIRSLESEVSHLLSENVSLREQVIALTQDLERFETAKTLHDGVYDVKTRLDSKIVELSSLITELGSLPRRYAKKTRDEPEPMGKKLPKDSNFTQQVKDANPDRTLELEANGKLPVILEDKCFPRRTLNAQELHELSNSDTDIPSSSGSESSAKSPKQGSEGDNVSIKSHIGYANTSAMIGYAENEHPLPPNLETRRKKRPGPIPANEVHGDTNSTSLLDSKFTRKCGAKRKFSAEDEENFFESAAAEEDDFEFNRPVQSPVRLSAQNSHSAFKMKTGQKQAAKSHVQQPKRKVLELKSTNSTIFSPTKSSTTKIQDKYQNHTIVGNNENSIPEQSKSDRSRSECSSPKKTSTPITSNDREMKYNKQEMKTEVGSDPMQFHDIEQPEITATPDMPNSRPSRRRGAVVSYTEPNLRDKMRRSTNELGPAVSGDRSRKSSTHADLNWDPQEQSSHKSSSVKKARGSKIANQDHNLVSDETPGEHLKRNLSVSPEKKPQSSARHIDGGKEDAEGQLQEQYVPGEKDLEDQFGNMLPHRDDIVQKDHPLSVHGRSDISMELDQAALVTNRKSRRHSSNTKSSGRNTIPRYCTSDMNAESLYNEMVTTCSGSGSSNSELSVFPTKADTFATGDQQESPNALSLMGSTGTGRGQRIAARRRSMVL